MSSPSMVNQGLKCKFYPGTPAQCHFYCPGCKTIHGVTVNGERNSSGATWGWNQSLDKPTFTPSILCNKGVPEWRCHSFVTEGNIQFLSDCYHDLAGKTVEIPDYATWESQDADL